MAFPYLSEENFEDATGLKRITGSDIATYTHFTGVTELTSIAVEHFSEVARTPEIAMPYSGAYVLRMDVDGTGASYLEEDSAWDTALSGTIYFRFMVWFGGSNLAMANNDLFELFKLESAGSTPECSVGIQYTTANGYRIYGNETGSVTGALLGDFSLNEWHTVEVECVIDSGAGNDGTIQLWLDGNSLGTKSSLDQGAIVTGFIGVIGPDAGTTGTLLIDSVISDDARIYPPTQRFAETVAITKSGHVMLGAGEIKNATLLSGANADNQLQIFDTNTGEITDVTNAKLTLFGTSASDQEVIDPAGVPIHIHDGAYVRLTGTADAYGPRAVVQICPDAAYGSDGAIRNFGARL